MEKLKVSISYVTFNHFFLFSIRFFNKLDSDQDQWSIVKLFETLQFLIEIFDSV